ncbi:beta-D-glucosyl crocetin beta-1,6-glucosyltransferase-like [Camellia sinensis]|uniref:beta-D-glucosyl crocetin beta-1,6-glucosyltransferase-like n=1 Tax=Camellia sinensis TaxID=4442 RepID=UPI00103677D0|nr:beta-D-glucosyl crocetin beta-1,6-glucosyltransferase-like [Camellia sinensis]
MAALKIGLEKFAPAFSTILKTLNPNLVIYDFNQTWVLATASSLNIPVVLFLSFGALFISFTFHHVFKNPNVEYPFRAIHLHEYERSSFESMLEFSANGVKEKDLIFESIKRSRDVMLLKTSRGLDGKYIDYFSTLVNKRIQPVSTLVQEPAKAKNDNDDGDGAINRMA